MFDINYLRSNTRTAGSTILLNIVAFKRGSCRDPSKLRVGGGGEYGVCTVYKMISSAHGVSYMCARRIII